MSSLQTHSRVAIFIYSRAKVRDRKLLARAEALNVKLKKIDIDEEKLTSTHFASLASDMSVDVSDLIDPRIIEGYKISDTEGTLKLINKNPELLKTPIVVTSECVKYIEDYGDLEAIDQLFSPSAKNHSVT
jgi:arsenate reductase (glutaredoxin)